MRANKLFRLKYISNGPANTGGFYHEDFWFKQVHQYLSQWYQVQVYSLRPMHYHSGLALYFWFCRIFIQSAAELTIIPVRNALPALLRRLFSKGCTWVVLHSLNNEMLRQDKYLAIYHVMLFKIIKKLPLSKVKLIVVSKFWYDQLKETYGFEDNKLGLLPNLFNPAEFDSFQKNKKERKIHLGMLSGKNHPIVFDIASRLSHRGYFCFFSTPEPYESVSAYGYSILSFSNRDDYLETISTCLFTLNFPKVPEGWSRVAHESFLLNVPVIGADNAGLGEQIREANGFLVETAVDVVELIEMQPGWKLPDKFIKKYHVNRAELYLKTLFDF